MNSISPILFFFFISLGISAQSSNLIFSNAADYPEDRYLEYSGSPYYFDKWVFADVYDHNGDIFEWMVVNYNIHEKVFEIRNGNKYIVVDPYFYWCVKVYKEDNGIHLKDFQDSILFIRGLMPDDEEKFVNVIYNGTHIKFLRDMQITKSVKTFHNIGQPKANKIFHRKDFYYLVINGEYKKIKFDKDDLIKVFGHKDELEKWLVDNNNTLKKDQEFSDFIEYVESTFYVN